jgi:hypothetical protein
MTVFPGSVHEQGEPIIWEKDCDGDPLRIDGAELEAKVKLLAACCLMTRYWPPKPPPGAKGTRHNAALVVGGFFSRAGYRRSMIREYVGAIAKVARDEEWHDRRKAAEDAAIAHGAGKHTFGFTGLADTFGKDIAEKIAEWLAYRGPDDEQPPRTEPDAAEEPPPQKAADLKNGTPATIRGRLLQFISMALDRSLTGQHVFRRCRVLLISLEGDRDELERRIDAVLKFYEIDRADLKGWLFCATPP